MRDADPADPGGGAAVLDNVQLDENGEPMGVDIVADSDPIFVPINVTARRIGVPLAWLRTEAEEGRVPAIRVDHSFRYSPESVDRTLLDSAGSEGARNV